MRVRFWGTRGSIATPGPGTNRYGGNTSCVEVTTNSGARFILDCGTGARPLGVDLMARAAQPVRATILLGHTHVPMLARVGDKLVVNPGSCGDARGAQNRLTFAELDFARGVACVYGIRYGAAPELLIEAGL